MYSERNNIVYLQINIGTNNQYNVNYTIQIFIWMNYIYMCLFSFIENEISMLCKKNIHFENTLNFVLIRVLIVLKFYNKHCIIMYSVYYSYMY